MSLAILCFGYSVYVCVFHCYWLKAVVFIWRVAYSTFRITVRSSRAADGVFVVFFVLFVVRWLCLVCYCCWVKYFCSVCFWSYVTCWVQSTVAVYHLYAIYGQISLAYDSLHMPSTHKQFSRRLSGDGWSSLVIASHVNFSSCSKYSLFLPQSNLSPLLFLVLV